MAGVFRVPMSGTFFGISLIASCLPAPAGAVVNPAKPGMTASSSATELAYWQSIATSNDIAQYDAYLARYPRGTFAKLARLKINALMAAQDAAGVPEVEVAGPIDEAPVGKAVLPASGRAAVAPVVTASAADVVAEGAGAAPPLPSAAAPPAPTHEMEQAAANAPWSAAKPALNTDDLGRGQAQQDMAQADMPPAPWGAAGEEQEGEDQAQEEQASAPAWPGRDQQQAEASQPLPPYFEREIEPPYRASSPGRVRAALPLRPRMASFRPLRLPTGFCSLASRDDFFAEEFRPAAEAAADNEERATAYLRAVQTQYDHYKFDGDVTGANITEQETAAYREIAGAAQRLNDEFDAKYDEMMRLPVGGCN